ncbi:MAG: hypothetical protein O3B46_05185 [Bacteroidetes bacterium]|jgi:hypothetical protein|nr:hypothetical protein [Bacteroidota bacterium]
MSKIKYAFPPSSLMFIVFLIAFRVGYSQSLYQDFDYKMPIDSAKNILKSKTKRLKNIAFGKGTLYAFRKKSLVERDNELISITIWSKKNLSLKEAESYLLKSRAHFESSEYKVVYAQENWSKPLLVKKNLPCIRFVDPEKTVLVEVDPRGQGGIYNIFVTFYNYDWFLRKARGIE